MEDARFNHIGWIALDDDNVTNVVSSLRKDNGRFICVVPLQSLEEFPAEWFIDSHFIGAKGAERVDIPSPLWLADSESSKTFCLIGCSRFGYKAFNFTYGYGRMTPEYVIEGGLGVRLLFSKCRTSALPAVPALDRNGKSVLELRGV